MQPSASSNQKPESDPTIPAARLREELASLNSGFQFALFNIWAEGNPRLKDEGEAAYIGRFQKFYNQSEIRRFDLEVKAASVAAFAQFFRKAVIDRRAGWSQRWCAPMVKQLFDKHAAEVVAGQLSSLDDLLVLVIMLRAIARECPEELAPQDDTMPLPLNETPDETQGNSPAAATD